MTPAAATDGGAAAKRVRWARRGLLRNSVASMPRVFVGLAAGASALVLAGATPARPDPMTGRSGPLGPSAQASQEQVALEVLGIAIGVFLAVVQTQSFGSPTDSPSVGGINISLDPEPSEFNVGDHTQVVAKFNAGFGSCADSDEGFLTVYISTSAGTRTVRGGPYGAVRQDFEVRAPIQGHNVGTDRITVEVDAQGVVCGPLLGPDTPHGASNKTTRDVVVDSAYQFFRDVQPTSVEHGGHAKATTRATIHTVLRGYAEYTTAHSSDGAWLVLPPAATINSRWQRDPLLEHFEPHRSSHLCNPPGSTTTFVVGNFETTFNIPAGKFTVVPRSGDWRWRIPLEDVTVADAVTCREQTVFPGGKPIEQHPRERPNDPPDDPAEPVAIQGSGRLVDDAGRPAVRGTSIQLRDGFGNEAQVTPDSRGRFSFSATLGHFITATYGGAPWYETTTTTAFRPDFVEGTVLRVERTLTPEVTGRLVNQARKPVAATIHVRKGDRSRRVGETSRDGTFRVGPLPRLAYLASPRAMVLEIRPLPQHLGQTFERRALVRTVPLGSKHTIDLKTIMLREVLRPTAKQAELTARIRQFDHLRRKSLAVSGLELVASRGGRVIDRGVTDRSGAVELVLPTGTELRVRSPNAAGFGVHPERLDAAGSVHLVADLDLGAFELPRSRPALRPLAPGATRVSGIANRRASQLVVTVNGKVVGTGRPGPSGAFAIKVPRLKKGNRVAVHEVFRGVAGPPGKREVA